MKYVFIVSGHKDKEAIFNRIRSAFRLLDDEMIVEETDHSGHAREIATAYATKYGDRCVIVCCGGDGTVHEIANGLAHTETPMMLLPLGTGNDFAKKVYGTKKINVENVIKSFGLYSGKLNYTVEPLDLIDYNGEKCINVMSYGLDTKVETIGRKIAGKIPPLGHQAYNIAVVPVMMQPLLRIDLSDVQLDFSAYQETLEQRQAELENTRQEELTSLIETETAAYISDKAKSMGLTLRVRVTAEMDGSGVPVPVRAELTGPWSGPLSGWLETELGLPAERQVWNEN